MPRRAQPKAIPLDSWFQVLREGPQALDAALAALADRPMDGLVGLTQVYLHRQRALETIESAFEVLQRENVTRSREVKAEVALLEDRIRELAQAVLRGSSVRSVEIPGLARVQLRKAPASVAVEDEELVLSYLEEHPDERERFTTVERHLLKSEWREHVKTTGEVVPGMRYTPEHDSVTIRGEA